MANSLSINDMSNYKEWVSITGSLCLLYALNWGLLEQLGWIVFSVKQLGVMRLDNS